MSSACETLIEASVLALRSADAAYGFKKGKAELRALLDGLPVEWRPRIFLADLAHVESLSVNRSPHLDPQNAFRHVDC